MAWGYDAAIPSRKRRSQAYQRSFPATEESLLGAFDRNRLRLECRDLYRNSALVRGIVERFADNVVGPNSIVPQAKTSDPKWNDRAESYWSQWAKIADYRQRANLRDLQRLVVTSRLLDGEIFFLLNDNGQITPIEAERCITPDNASGNVVEGVALSSDGIPAGYYFAERDEYGRPDPELCTYVPKENVIHCYNRSYRVDAVRGVPELAPVINALRDYDELSDATLNKAKLDSLRAYAVHTDGDYGPGNLGPRNATPDGQEDNQTYERIEDGQIYYLRPNEKIDPLNSQHPSSTYKEFSELTIRLIGSALSLPGLEVLLLDFSSGSFSSSRAALLQTYRTFESWQSYVTETFLSRLWNWQIAKTIKAKALPPAPIDDQGISEWFNVQWSTPECGWVDPRSESMANQTDYLMGTTSITALVKKKGRDAEDVLAEKAADIETAHLLADDLNKKYGTDLTWRDLITAGIPGQVTTPASSSTGQSGQGGGQVAA